MHEEVGRALHEAHEELHRRRATLQKAHSSGHLLLSVPEEDGAGRGEAHAADGADAPVRAVLQDVIELSDEGVRRFLHQCSMRRQSAAERGGGGGGNGGAGAATRAAGVLDSAGAPVGTLHLAVHLVPETSRRHGFAADLAQSQSAQDPERRLVGQIRGGADPRASRNTESVADRGLRHLRREAAAPRVRVQCVDELFHGRIAEPSKAHQTDQVRVVHGARRPETEARARDVYPELDVYYSSFRPLVHTLTGRDEMTAMKLLVDKTTDRVVGVHMLGRDAAEIVQGFAVAIKCGATKAQFDATIGIHPTSAEELVTMREPLGEGDRD